jgi:hypothetical protein
METKNETVTVLEVNDEKKIKKSMYVEIGDKMKKYENDFSDKILDESKPYIMRLDGHTFHTFARDFVKPFDVNRISQESNLYWMR